MREQTLRSSEVVRDKKALAATLLIAATFAQEGEKAVAAEAAPAMEYSQTGLMIYGIVANVFMYVPIVMYLGLGSTLGVTTTTATPTTATTSTVAVSGGNVKYHQTMVNMLTSAWAPLAIAWIFLQIEDSQAARTALIGAMHMTDIGIFALHWMGAMSFIMQATNASALGAGINIFWAIFYICASVGMVVFQQILQPGVYNWIKNAPIPVVAMETKEVAPTSDAAADEATADDGSIHF